MAKFSLTNGVLNCFDYIPERLAPRFMKPVHIMNRCSTEGQTCKTLSFGMRTGTKFTVRRPCEEETDESHHRVRIAAMRFLALMWRFTRSPVGDAFARLGEQGGGRYSFNLKLSPTLSKTTYRPEEGWRHHHHHHPPEEPRPPFTKALHIG